MFLGTLVSRTQRNVPSTVRCRAGAHLSARSRVAFWVPALRGSGISAFTRVFDALWRCTASGASQSELHTGKNRFSAGMKKIPRLIAKPMLQRIERSVGRLPR
ncbi:hypothetical protein TM239_06510 [Bradyrhizobium sp. TM239]|nr:hypothetical protein TM239_06510 [Bradyrhizobium sp. TM239]